MVMHRRIGGIGIPGAERAYELFMLFQRLLRDAAVEHQAKDVQVDMLIGEGLTHHIVVGDRICYLLHTRSGHDCCLCAIDA